MPAPASADPGPSHKPTSATLPQDVLLELIHRARSAESTAAVRFIAVNDSHLLAPYQQAALWDSATGVAALSGVTDVDANVPYVAWLNQVLKQADNKAPALLTRPDIQPSLAADWNQWLPEHVLTIPFSHADGRSGCLLVARELAWREIDRILLGEWMQVWCRLSDALDRPGLTELAGRSLRRATRIVKGRPLLWTLLASAVLLFPVRLSVLAPAEIVPASPLAIRAPFQGTIKTVAVQSNEAVQAGQVLFQYDDMLMESRVKLAGENLATAEAELRQYSQQAMNDPRARAALSRSRGLVEEKRLELDYAKTQLGKGKVTAPAAGIVFMDDPSDWIGRPVEVGQRVLRLADPKDKEIEAWLAIPDAIDLPQQANVKLYLTTAPLSPIEGTVRFVAYEPTLRPEGHYAYRVRASVAADTPHRIGLKGTLRLDGQRVPLVYWLLRRPFAALRELLGV